MRILIVDDHALVREGIRAVLAAQADLEVVGEAADAEQARQQVEALAPDLVLMDVNIRNDSGITLTGELTAAHPKLAVLMLSMYDNPEYVHQSRQAGARGYVLKDAPSADILAAIETIAAGGHYLSAALARATRRSEEPRPLLSERECDILACLGRGLSSKQIAAQFDLSVRTVETHRQNIRRKLKICGQAELIRYAVQRSGSPGDPAATPTSAPHDA
ncbi:LuxR family two component transcriptional regulator [Sphaerotilus hippei]|uniref:LuxR family two component transcriptional regulator n=1 Tax=Sphaerotilus hippei TaxID=744406 RepID=A0A318H9P5_9BURK|nr:response regulator transcription factor [Sphaerotilus hippei]PXW98788.1 LuxR family two component transcriptional regulator [Sphaerotilus hippei]